ncbi:PAS domain S-box-containing protein/diguanylate cyclase (GGDEF)-like protein [Paucimonas lemoignei]|uniref:PAS domain S-box-containing protein/diguanylate cyclase (GGDEF)-like protein n=1 Tax=Paucimonas lemoignei TaxID=29443 RepID=A0A4V2UJE7_PAULE|nr:bifunctional diguanylate cyclase/phosphodiesterase [Paucimonas lemoignei]TCS39500.1 PAS domain S-box-containing protein/diguanylate cyclase (GGDEF)-like protein [Paucimonas lemoignei]
MRLPLLRSTSAVTTCEVFRVASLFFYIILLAHLTMTGSLSLALSSASRLALGLLLPLSLLSLFRFLRPGAIASRQWLNLFEMGVVMLAVSLLVLDRSLPLIGLPWLIAVAGVFMLPLESGTALAAACTIVLLSMILGSKLNMSLSEWLPHVYATLFVGLLARLLDRTLKQNAQALEQAKLDQRRFDAIARATRHVIMIVDARFQIMYVNPAIQEITGYTEDEMRNLTIKDVNHPDDVTGRREKLRYLRDNPGSSIFSRHRTRHKNGNWVWVEARGYNLLQDPAIKGLVFSVEDISERMAYEVKLEHQAMHDPLTGLPNRRHVLKRLGIAIDAHQENGARLAVLVCNLDFFKSLNDIHGHDFGDRCLLELTRRIVAELPSSDFIARFGGNEFVVLTDADLAEAKIKAETLLAAVSQQFVVDDVIVKIQASVGIAFVNSTHKTPSALLRDADAAMYQAKERGRNRVEIFDAALQHLHTRRAQLDVALRFSMERNELSLHYQPKVSLEDGSIKGFELLLRWHHPEHGEIAPQEFIPIAEASGVIVPIGLWVLEMACLQVRSWSALQDTVAPTIAVNVSMRQLLQSSFLQDVAAILERTGAAPSSIELELTETSAMANPLQTVETLLLLKQMGFRLALDDFGTGYSSLAYLQKLPLDVLKIDKAFINGLCSNSGDAEIVRLILALAHTLKLETVAEGVETEEQATQLLRMGCHLAQGYAFSRSLSADEAEQLLRTEAVATFEAC